MIDISQQERLVRDGLATRKFSGNLALYKYHRRVMYDYMWFDRPELMECRGHVYDYKTGELVVAAPRKSFNYLENGWWKDKPLDTLVRVEKKYNGFLLNVTRYKGDVIYTTTGSFDSNFVKLGKSYSNQMFPPHEGYTDHYEICDSKNDPHIVKEEDGAKLLGVRNVKTGESRPVPTSIHYNVMRLEQALSFRNYDDIEGVMLFDGQDVCKLKTYHYSVKKKLMRMSPDNLQKFYKSGNLGIDCGNAQYLADHVQKYGAVIGFEKLEEQQRRYLLDKVIEEHYRED